MRRKRSAEGYPAVFPAAGGGAAGEPEVFEPALAQYVNAFRLGEPKFASPADRQRWHAARAEVIAHLLRLVHPLAWQRRLVLRGSLLLQAWLGEAAREPGDIDWVVTPSTLGIRDSDAQELVDAMVRAPVTEPQAGGGARGSARESARILADRVATDDIWTYERAPGIRILYPWEAPGLPPGSVQMDLVFGERMWTNPVVTPIPAPDGEDIYLWTVDKPLALAWKLLWLESDMHPQGKDLYDAALLAEQTELPLRLLKDVMAHSGEVPEHQITADFAMRWQVDWKNFTKEYPWVWGQAADWQARLTDALAPTFR